ncbi:hypothetical protein ON010_g8744 [Phytophthora cinnamomi]|nr:hypothetical protein ON010_g8744 [Phytophthora cinnamomi]
MTQNVAKLEDQVKREPERDVEGLKTRGGAAKQTDAAAAAAAASSAAVAEVSKPHKQPDTLLKFDRLLRYRLARRVATTNYRTHIFSAWQRRREKQQRETAHAAVIAQEWKGKQDFDRFLNDGDADKDAKFKELEGLSSSLATVLHERTALDNERQMVCLPPSTVTKDCVTFRRERTMDVDPSGPRENRCPSSQPPRRARGRRGGCRHYSTRRNSRPPLDSSSEERETETPRAVVIDIPSGDEGDDREKAQLERRGGRFASLSKSVTDSCDLPERHLYFGSRS